MTLSRRSLVTALVCITAVLVLGAGARAEAAPALPAWSLTVVSYPTNFVPKSENTSTNAGPGYMILATNVGGATTTGSFTVTDTLPAGVTVSPSSSPAGFFGRDKAEHHPSCSTAGQTVTCTGGAPGVGPGEKVQITIPVKLSTAVREVVTDEALIFGGGAPGATTASTVTKVTATPAEFGLLEGAAGFYGAANQADGSPSKLAGSHPYQLTVGLGFPAIPAEAGQGSLYGAGGGLRDASVVLPPGMVADPAAVGKCKESELESIPSNCPADSQVGTVRVSLSLASVSAGVSPLYNMKTSPGSPGEFGFEVVGLQGTYVHLRGHVRSDGDYELSAGASDAVAKAGILGVQTNLWGDPSDESHDAQRGKCFFAPLSGLPEEALCPVERTNKAFLTMPSACSESLTARVFADSWLSPGLWAEGGADITANPGGVEGCANLQFRPTIELQPDETNADSPTGLSAKIHLPQNESYENEIGEPEFATATLRDAKVVLPAGVSVNPSAANGRGACTTSQIGLTSPVGQPTDIHFQNEPANCPNDAKVGTVEVITPLLQDEPEPGTQTPHPLDGSVYLATPFENPFGSLLALYIAVGDPETGIVIKLAGKVEADAVTGQLTTTFSENPQLPFEDLKLTFTGGPRAPLRTPTTCGSFSSQSEFISWASPTPVFDSELFPVEKGAGGGACVSSASQLPNGPKFEAGTTSPLAGRYSPFVMWLARSDGSQELAALNVSLPQGLTGKLAGTPYCPDSALAAAAAASGRGEEAVPSCPKASEVGTVTVGAGAGSQPYYAHGIAYLAGPYKGAPLSLAIVTPAVAGPFDLGDVVVRAALVVDPFTARITVKSDPLPRILQGIPLDVRSIAVQIGKPEFILNPTSCEPMVLGAEAISTTGSVAPMSTRFQVSNCRDLQFKPRLKISLKGGTRRADHPALKATVTYPQKGIYANIARAQVGLPHSEFLDQNNLNKVCTQPQLKSESCPAKSIYGHAKAWSPLLEKPLEGPVYLAVGFGYKLPALVADLNGQVRILLKGRVDTTKQNGIRNTFEAVPDAPVSKFILEMKGGKNYGLLENSEDICARPQRASANFVAQTGASIHSRPLIANSCTTPRGGKKGDKPGHKRNRSPK